MRSAVVRYALMVAGLCLVSLAVLEAPWRFEVLARGLTIAPPDQIPKSWIVSRKGVSEAAPEEGGGLVLDAGASRSVPYVATTLRRSSSFSHLRVRADMRAVDLRPGRRHDLEGALIIVSFGEKYRAIRYWPQRVLRFDEDQDWRSHSAVFPLHENTKALQLIVYNAARSGQLGLRRIELVPLSERPLFIGLRALMAALWAAFFVFCAWSLMRVEGHRLPKAALVLLFGVATAAIIMPQPYYSEIVHEVEDLAEDLASAAAWPLTIGRDRSAPAPEPTPESEPKAEPESDPKSEAAQEQPDGAAQSEKPADSGRGSRAGGGLRFVGGQERRLFEWLSFKEAAHFSMFLVLAGAALLTFRQQRKLPVLAFLTLFAIASEFLQLFVATRSSSMTDLLVNAAGLVSGALAALALLTVLARLPARPGRLREPGPGPDIH